MGFTLPSRAIGVALAHHFADLFGRFRLCGAHTGLLSPSCLALRFTTRWATQRDDRPELLDHPLDARHDAAPVELEKHLPSDLPLRTTPARCRTARWRETTDWSCGISRQIRWMSDRAARGEQLHDLDAHRFAQGAEQLRVDNRSQLVGGALSAAAGGNGHGGMRFHSHESIHAHTCMGQGFWSASGVSRRCGHLGDVFHAELQTSRHFTNSEVDQILRNHSVVELRRHS